MSNKYEVNKRYYEKRKANLDELIKTQTKYCKDCGFKLTVGENLSEHKFLNQYWRCIDCEREVKGTTKKKGRPVNYKTEEERKQQKRDRYNKSKSKYPPSIYGFKWEDKWIYIGESKKPQLRKEQHLWMKRSTFRKWLDKNPHIKPTFHIIEEIDNQRERLIKEFELIAKYKPIANHPYRE